MSVITNLINTNDGSVSMGVINTNIDNLNTDKLEAADITGIDETQLDVSVNASLDLADSASQATGVENNADVTDVTNVTTAGALMDSEITNLAQVKAFDTTDYATSAQGATADAALQKAGGTMTGKIVKAGTTEVAKTYTPATGAQTVALDCNVNNVHQVTGHADGTAMTFTIANATSSQPFIVSILQGATTVSTIAAWFATVRWAGGTAPTLTATLNKRDTFGFIRTSADQYDGFIIGQNC